MSHLKMVGTAIYYRNVEIVPADFPTREEAKKMYLDFQKIESELHGVLKMVDGKRVAILDSASKMKINCVVMKYMEHAIENE